MQYILDDNLPEIKPCPSCGKAPSINVKLAPIDGYRIKCVPADCHDTGWHASLEAAIDKWNELISK